jgi:uncharacterized protein YbaR (Trm112 family)
MTKSTSQTIKTRKVSKNKRAQEIVGLRDIPPNAIPIDQPCELGYHCPVCKYKHFRGTHMDWDERLEWSEYEGFLWCSVCNKDYPSCLCIPMGEPLPGFLKKKFAADYAIEIYLDAVDRAINRRAELRYPVKGKERKG